jgi:hypothetical protein
MAWEMRDEVFCDTDRAHAGTAATVWDAECLMQVQVAYIAAEVTGSAEADHRIHVGAIEVDLSAM